MDKKIKVIQYGLGPIGNRITRYLMQRKSFEIVGAIDSDPAKLGRDVGELSDLREPLGVTITDDARNVLENSEADAVILTTTSSLSGLLPQVMEIISYNMNIVSTCEELSYPWLTDTEISHKIDTAAKEAGVSVLGTGVNPGFLMDFLPVALTGISLDVKKITVERFQNAEFRRLPFQKKIGAGLTVERFYEKVTEKTLRHVGLTESMHMIAECMNWRLDNTEETVNPVIADQKIVSDDLQIEEGMAIGVDQQSKAYANGEEVIRLVFRATIGEPDPHDRVYIEGTPNIDMTIKGGVNGDIATCSIIVNAIPAIINAQPGLKTMADIEPVTFFRSPDSK